MLLKRTVHLPRIVKTKGMSMWNARVLVPWDLLEPFVIQSSQILVSHVLLCFCFFFPCLFFTESNCVVWFLFQVRLKFYKRSVRKYSQLNCVLLFDFPNQDCGGFIHLKENDPSLERDSDVTVISPNYPGPVGQDKICRWAITVNFSVKEIKIAYTCIQWFLYNDVLCLYFCAWLFFFSSNLHNIWIIYSI